MGPRSTTAGGAEKYLRSQQSVPAQPEHHADAHGDAIDLTRQDEATMLSAQVRTEPVLRRTLACRRRRATSDPVSARHYGHGMAAYSGHLWGRSCSSPTNAFEPDFPGRLSVIHPGEFALSSTAARPACNPSETQPNLEAVVPSSLSGCRRKPSQHLLLWCSSDLHGEWFVDRCL